MLEQLSRVAVYIPGQLQVLKVYVQFVGMLKTAMI